MERRKGVVHGLIVFLVLMLTVEAYKRNPLKDPQICGRPVCSKTSKFRYNVGHLYKYDHSMYVKTALVGSGDNTSELHISSVVEIDFYAPCQGILRLYSIEVRERAAQAAEEEFFEYGEEPEHTETSDVDETGGVHPKSDVIAEELMRFELRFAFHDGAIGEICHEDSESVWTLNLKRGILSALQNTMPRFDIDYDTTETDVSGICDVQYKTNGRNGTSLLFRKTKDLVSCKRRYKTTSFIQTVPYDFRTNYVAWPILNSNSYCDFSIDNSIYKSVACYERHQLVPFSNGLAGAVTETYNRLELADEETYVHEGNNEIDIQRRSSLLYDHTPSVHESHDEIKASRELLMELCVHGFPNIRRDFPDVFLKFLTAARALSSNALYQLLTRSRAICDNGHKHILESLPYIGSAASVTLMKDQIVENNVGPALANKWMESFAFLTRPNEEVLEAMLQLMKHGKESCDQTYLLSGSTVVNTFCKIHSNCGESEAVQAIVQYLEEELLDTIQSAESKLQHDRRKRERVIVLLMSLGNMGVVNKRLNFELRTIIESERYPTEVRVEAVNVFRRSDCTRTKDYFLKLYSTFLLDVEVRIAAYLQAMRCPDHLSVRLIKNVLKTEEVKQVGSFVWSHLTNLAKSASPVRVQAQGLLAENDLDSKFNLDIRKFSRNYEQTLFFDEYNFGMTVDSNVIFSTESYVPRSVRLNLTTDLFGESINFLELNVRLEGLEQSVHHLFGPNGTYSAKKVGERVDTYMKFLRQYVPTKVLELFDGESSWRDELQDAEENGRGKRAAVQRLPVLIARQIQEDVDRLGFQLKGNFDKPQVTIGVKTFGNDLNYYTDGLEIFSKVNQRKKLASLFDGKESSYTKSSVFLDTSYDVPLSSGMPLALGLVGASSVDLRLTGKIRAFDYTRWLIDIEGKLKPSITMDITASMRSDLMHASTAIKAKTNLYSNSAWAAHLKLRGTDQAVLQVSLPQERNDIFSIRSEMFVLTERRELQQAGIERRYSNSTCTWPFIDQAIGLKMCTNYSLPDVSNTGKDVEVPSLILSGPVNFDVSLEKADPTAKMFVLKYSWAERQNQTIVGVVFETPNSQIPRIFRANITNEVQRKTASMSFVNGNISHKAIGMYINNPNQQRVEMSLNVNDRKYLALEMGLNKTDTRNGRMYYPSFYLSVNHERIAGLEMALKEVLMYRANFDLRSSAYPHFDVALNGTLLDGMGHLDFTLLHNNAPDLRDEKYRTTLKMIFARDNPYRSQLILTPNSQQLIGGSAEQTDPTERTTLSVEMTRPRSKIDVKGVWFTEHAANVSGWYKDRSSNVKYYHYAKLAAQIGLTNSTRELFGVMKYIQDEHDNRLSINAMFEKKPYGIILQHTQQIANGTKSYAMVQWKDERYWFSALMKSAPIKQLDLELHIDKIRDISATLRGYKTPLKREVGVEFKWDANRDPTQRIALTGELNTPTDRIYDGLFLLSYPNRTFSGTFDLKAIHPRYLANARISWNTTEAIVIHFDAGTHEEMLSKMWLLLHLNTTFHGWRRNALSGAFSFKDNVLYTDLIANWAEDQRLGVELNGTYRSNKEIFNCELGTQLKSSLRNIPAVTMYFNQTLVTDRVETTVLLNYETTDQPVQEFSVRSNWQHKVDKRHSNITGSLRLISPYENYRMGALVAKVSVSDNRTITGAADLQLDDNTYDLLLEGHIRNLVDCMLTANITSSNINYRSINGRFGISEKNRHLVAEIITPKTELGIELLYAVVSPQNFDVKFHLATPLKELEKVILRAKLQKDNVDFRAGMNNMVLGCTGVWRKAHLKDFEYSYRIYTPLQKFEESALIVKVVINSERAQYVDVELSGKFSEYKLGVKAMSKPKPDIKRVMLPQTASSLVEENLWNNEVDDEQEDEDYDEEEDEENLLNFIGEIELYTIVMPTIEGTLELTEQNSQYRAIGKLKVPQGDIDFRDRFYLRDLLNMHNSLQLKTPFPVAQQITSEFVMKFSHETTDITVGMNVKFNNRTEWVNTGFHVNYKKSVDEAEVHKHQALVDLMTPMKNLQKVFLNGTLELEDHSYKGNLTAKTMTTDASLALSFEAEDQFIDTFMSVWVRAPLMPYYACRVFYKQDFSRTENSMDLGFTVNDGDLYSNFRMDGAWSFAKPHYIKGAGKYQSNFLPINLINTDFLITRSPLPRAHCNVKFHDKHGVVEEIKARAERNRELFMIDLSVPMEDYRNFSIHGRLQHRQGSEYAVSGQLYRNEHIFQVEGSATIAEDIPYRAELAFQPLTPEGSIGSIRYDCRNSSTSTEFNLEVESGNKVAKMDGSFKLLAMSDWFLKLGLESSEPGLKSVDFYMGINPEANGKALGKFNLHSPWVQYGIDQADVEMMFDVQPISGSVVARYGIRDVSGNASCLWNWALKSNTQFALENRVLRNSVERYFRTGVRYVSPDLENNHNLTFGGDLNLNNIWIFSANSSVDFISIRDMSAVLKVLLPKPVGDVHTLALAMNGNLPFLEPVKSFNMETSYETDESRKRYAYHSEYSGIGDIRALVRFDWGPDVRKERIQSILNVFRIGDRQELMVTLRGPWYLEDAFVTHGTYDTIENLYLVSGNISMPASTKVMSANVIFNDLSNMKADVNCTTPFLNVSWIHGQLEFIESPIESIRYVKGSWPESSAIFDAKATYRNNNQDREQQGTVKMEVPLQTRHFAEIKYGLSERPAITTGYAEVEYNSKNVLSGQYTSKEESRPGFDKETIEVMLKNEYKPIGVHYVHSVNKQDPTVESLDFKRAEIFELDNKEDNKFNVTGELHVLSKEKGREYIVRAIQTNRTVELTANIEEDNIVSKKQSRLQLAPTVWIAYDFERTNRSRDDVEAQNFTLKISYPNRNISADGWYSYTSSAFDSDITLSYSPNRTNAEDESEMPKQRTVRGGVVWRDLANRSTDGQQIRVFLGHPSFQRDVTVDARYFTDPKHWFSSKAELRYNDDNEHLLAMGLDLNDMQPIVGFWNYSYHLFSTHEASDLDLDSIGSIGLRPGLWGVSSNSHYKRAYLSQMHGHVLGWMNLHQKEMHYERITSQSKYRIWTKATGAYPVYLINGTLLDGPELDATGFFYLNIDDKMVQMKINMTPDGSENVYMYGIIPDTRSAYFDLWRDYDKAREVDVTYYLKMNHSRLITGHLLWRPEIKSDVQKLVRDYVNQMHQSFMESIEFWIKQVYLETKDSTMTFLHNTTQEIAESPHFNTIINFTNDVELLYRDLTTNDLWSNLQKYSSVLWEFLHQKYFQLIPFAEDLHLAWIKLLEEVKQLRKIDFVHYFIQRYEEVQAYAIRLAEEFEHRYHLTQVFRLIGRKLLHLEQTALEAEDHYRKAKTKFIFDPDRGVIELEQKLPMSWHAFNETPKFEEIPEFKYISKIQDLFAGSNTTIWTVYNDICPYVDLEVWLPPFKSTALLIGSRHYMSFDKRFVSLDLNDSNRCQYLLAHDYYNRTITLLLESSDLKYGQTSRQITLIIDDNTLAIDVFNISVKINNKATALPAMIGTQTVVFQQSDQLWIQSQRGFLVGCSLRYHICWLELSGWYFGKMAGLLGTMNNEMFDDRITSTNRYNETEEQFLNSWALPGCSSTVTATNHTSNFYSASNELSQLCDSFFHQKLSYLATCFSVVDVTPFYEMCMDLGHNLMPDRGACTAAIAYIQACGLERTPLRVPNNCISCLLMNGSYVPEGSFVPLRNEEVPKAADVVFIIEAKPCNERFVETKSINLLVSGIARELQDLGIDDTLFGVVTFGGSAPFDRAHSVVVGNSVFEMHNGTQPFFDHVKIGNGTNEDIFDAITMASNLVFRPGASKTFVLLPCSRCVASKMKLDFSSIVQLLVENDIKLHILADQELSFQKSRVSRLFYGMDSQMVYTKKDVKELIGDAELRRQIQLPKATLGECIALAMETNGSIFGGHKLRQDRSNTANTKKFIKVFAKRIAASALPNSCQTCECTGHNTGVAYMQCTPCNYPSPFSMEDGNMTDDMLLSVMQPDGEWDDGF
uniref:Vitellogenin domain-containing protein n=1 Tax=Anopheles coluzzii TaxID=1518534 RepID=A0A8W7PWS0_ANOCL